PNEKLADSLSALQALQKEGRRVIPSRDLSRVHRERLLRNGFVQEVMKGWLISSSPSARDDSTPWYASFWEFCGRYCQDRFGDEWHLSPEQSLLLHAENTVIPTQVVIYTPRGTNNAVKLPFGTSIYDLKQADMPPATDVVVRDGLRLYSPAAALVKVPEAIFNRYPIESRVALASIGDASEVLRRLLDGGHSVVAGRLAGAFRLIGRPDVADEIVAAMKAANYTVRETHPFAAPQIFGPLRPATAPIVGHMQAMWQAMRDSVMAAFPKAPGLPRDRGEYLKFVDEIYKSDAYHSLSIEGYSVTPDLVDRVRAGGWDPDHRDDDRKNRDALAARGYWQAFQAVKGSVSEIIAGANPGSLTRTAHRDWYRELFQPCVAAGLLRPGVLAAYRSDAVYLRTSRFVPPRWEAVRDAMPALFGMLEQETEPGVRAVLGHWMFGYIHPYPDGNGRMARFLMNAMLASGGYPWTVVRVEDRDAYLAALDRASIDRDIGPFAAFMAERVQWSIKSARAGKQ
ncbi:MAG TPA: Fic family protein, partial [Vicinamibacteria bacterium]|nr:Fic family protein [Vicinamibacteria bacterium]